VTKKLFYEDSHIKEFDAKVISCLQNGDKYEIELDETAFFPEGGGQSADTGTLDDIAVTYTHSKGDAVLHVTEAPIAVGTEVHGKIDWQKRFSNMQNHSAEHIVSGLVYKRYGFNNVGFHMGEDGVIVDFDGYIPPEELKEIEREANRIITENRAVIAFFPEPKELSSIKYRSKLELTENIRLVIIEGCDVCACCAPHVKHTGEIGVLKIFESIRRKNGIRLRMLAGSDAFEDYCKRAESAAEISAMLSVPQDNITDAVRKLESEKAALSYELGGLRRELIKYKVENLKRIDGNLLFFEPSFNGDDAKFLVNGALPYCGKICAVFFGTETDGYKYCMASENVNLRDKAKEINTALSGRGGGKPEMISGTVNAARDEIEKYFEV
jgi:alanyl-tRNA synthetase